MKKIEIVVLINENNIISAVKVNNDLFLKSKDESEVDFYNKRIIPELRKKGIDFIKSYKDTENIIVDNIVDYKMLKSDNVNISKTQISKILDSSSYRALDYDQKLYVENLYYKILKKKYDYYSEEHWRFIRNMVSISKYCSIDDLKLEQSGISVDNCFNLNNLKNPLFENDVIGYVLGELKNNPSYSMYDILTSYGGTRSKVNIDDFVDFKNLKFRVEKKNSVRYERNLIKKFNLWRLSNTKPFNSDNLNDFDRYSRIFLSDWIYLPITEESLHKKTTHRIYVNVPLENVTKLALEIYESFNKNNIKYGAKFDFINKRDDQMVIYSDEMNFLKALRELNNIYYKSPYLFNEKCKTAITTAKIDIPGVGIAHEPDFVHTSHNVHIANVLDRALSVASLKYILDTNDIEFKNKLINPLLFLYFGNENVYEKNSNDNTQKILSKIINNLDAKEVIFDKEAPSYRSQTMWSGIIGERDRIINESTLYDCVRYSICACKDLDKLKRCIIEELYVNAEKYRLNPSNMAFNYSEYEEKVLQRHK